MSTLGLTKLKACNEMLMALGLNRVAALDSGGSSDVAEAEYVLDAVTREYLLRGWSCNTKLLTITASNAGTIDLNGSPTGQSPATPAPLALRIEGDYKSKYKPLSLRGSMVYDEAVGSTTAFAANETVYLKVVEALSASSPNDFEDISPEVKEQIVKEAVQRYRVRKRPDPTVDAMLDRDVAKSQAAYVANRPSPSDVEAPRFGPAPVSQQQQGGRR